MRAAFLLSPSFINQGRMGASKAALILMKNCHFDRTTQYNSEVKSFDQCLPKTTDGALKVSFIYLQSHKPIGISIRNLNSYRKNVFAGSLGGSLE